MSEEIINNCKIEHNGDVNIGLDYLKNHWDDRYVLDVFENAKTSENHFGDFKINGINGTYLLKYIGEHHYSLTWRNY
ncbi:MAG TPA: hypothetical protein VK675_04335 [Candidatus Paceibacterota bacterium]|nr:hypothetical protein [Candidatus Paceibacterota bacterium]